MEVINTKQEDDRFVVQNHLEIIHILKDLAQRKTMLNISFNQGKDSCLTTVVSIDVEDDVVFLDIGCDELFNSRLFSSRRVVFTKDVGLRIRWVSDDLTEVALQDGKAIKIAIPHEITRIQRREFFRVPTVILDPIPCQIPIPDEDAAEEKYLELYLTDASVGGIGVLAPDPLDPMLTKNASFDRCKIFFPDVGTTSLTLRVQSIYPVTLEDGSIRHHVGMQFIDPSRGNQAMIHRYMTILEREAMAVKKKQD